MSRKRSQRLTAYYKVRQEFLAAHPYCQWAIDQAGLQEAEVVAKQGHFVDKAGNSRTIPPSTEVHHKRGRVGDLLTNKEFFMAVSSHGHRMIHHYTGLSYERGYMLPR